jgi:hypothetical protein
MQRAARARDERPPEGTGGAAREAAAPPLPLYAPPREVAEERDEGSAEGAPAPPASAPAAARNSSPTAPASAAPAAPDPGPAHRALDADGARPGARAAADHAAAPPAAIAPADEALVRRADAHFAAGRASEAAALYRALLARHPRDARAPTWKRRIEAAAGAAPAPP